MGLCRPATHEGRKPVNPLNAALKKLKAPPAHSPQLDVRVGAASPVPSGPPPIHSPPAAPGGRVPPPWATAEPEAEL